MRANVSLMGMGGIVAYYPTETEFHYPGPQLPPGSTEFKLPYLDDHEAVVLYR